MKFKLDITIDKPRLVVWQAFTNPDNINKQQPSLTNIEVISGTQGQPGSASKLTYEESGREFSLIEKITLCDEPNQLDVLYENEFTDNPTKNIFIEHGEDQTLWVIEAEYKFKTLPMKLLGPLVKKNFIRRTQRDMEGFKDFMEKE